MRSAASRLSAVAIFAFALLPQAASGRLASAQSPPPVGGTPPPYQDPGKHLCAKSHTSAHGVIPEPPRSSLAFCGSRGNDVLRSHLGHIYDSGSSGNDVIMSKNGKEDLISGGTGNDRAVIDQYDAFARGTARASGIERCQPVAICRSVSSSFAPASSRQLEYPYSLASIQCQPNTTSDAAQHPYMVRFAEEPTDQRQCRNG